MGIKIRNDTHHDIFVVVFTYIPMPHPSLVYRKTLLIPSGERFNCPTWQSAVKIMAWEAPVHDCAISEEMRQNLSDQMAAVNVGRLLLVPIGGELLSMASTAADILIDGVMDSFIHDLLELAIDEVIARLENEMERGLAQEVRARQLAAARLARESTRGVPMAKKTFFLTYNALFLRRQFSIHHNHADQLKINGAGMS
ncbi:hypothetical protein SPRG_17917, partial [Saprolegnia parasitica CBS 223.65]